MKKQNEMEKVSDAAFAVEDYLISIANSRGIDVVELGLGIMALLLKRFNDSNGIGMVKEVIAGMIMASMTMEKKEKENDNAA